MTSLIDSKNPARWATGEPRSQNNGFTRGLTDSPIDWAAMQRRANLRTTSSKAVDRRRANGEQVGTIALMGRNPKAVFSIENAKVGEKSRDKRAKLRRGTI
jgi:hypothetical protein